MKTKCNWQLTTTSFAHSTENEIILDNGNSSLEIAYFPKDQNYGYSFILTNEEGDIIKDTCGHARTVEDLIILINEDKEILKYIGDVDRPSDGYIKVITATPNPKSNHYKTTVDGLIACLTRIKEKCGGDTHVQINVLGGECVTGLVSVCLDNDMGNDNALVYLETDTEERYCPETFSFYTQGEEV